MCASRKPPITLCDPFLHSPDFLVASDRDSHGDMGPSQIIRMASSSQGPWLTHTTISLLQETYNKKYSEVTEG